MKKGLTEMVFILDRSGSMHGLESDTIGGFNSMLDKQKSEEGEAYVTTVLFDDTCETIHDRLPVLNVPQMTAKQYEVRGCTALLDAIGSTVNHVMNIHKYAREEDVPEHTMVVIMTDGMENASRNYSYDDVKKLISAQEKEKGWHFVFMGANIDAVETGSMIGVKASRAVNFANDSRGQRLNYEAISCMASDVRHLGDFEEDVVFKKIKAYEKEKNKK